MDVSEIEHEVSRVSKKRKLDKLAGGRSESKAAIGRKLAAVMIPGGSSRVADVEKLIGMPTTGRKPMDWCKGLLDMMLSKKHKATARLFYSPVDPTEPGLSDYLDVIKRPMDLHTIKNKLEARVYRKPWQFAQDVRQIFFNCYRYNDGKSKQVKMAYKLQKTFELAYARIPIKHSMPPSSQGIVHSASVKDLKHDDQALQALAYNMHESIREFDILKEKYPELAHNVQVLLRRHKPKPALVAAASEAYLQQEEVTNQDVSASKPLITGSSRGIEHTNGDDIQRSCSKPALVAAASEAYSQQEEAPKPTQDVSASKPLITGSSRRIEHTDCDDIRQQRILMQARAAKFNQEQSTQPRASKSNTKQAAKNAKQQGPGSVASKHKKVARSKEQKARSNKFERMKTTNNPLYCKPRTTPVVGKPPSGTTSSAELKASSCDTSAAVLKVQNHYIPTEEAALATAYMMELAPKSILSPPAWSSYSVPEPTLNTVASKAYSMQGDAPESTPSVSASTPSPPVSPWLQDPADLQRRNAMFGEWDDYITKILTQPNV